MHRYISVFLIIFVLLVHHTYSLPSSKIDEDASNSFLTTLDFTAEIKRIFDDYYKNTNTEVTVSPLQLQLDIVPTASFSVGPTILNISTPLNFMEDMFKDGPDNILGMLKEISVESVFRDAKPRSEVIKEAIEKGTTDPEIPSDFTFEQAIEAKDRSDRLLEVKYKYLGDGDYSFLDGDRFFMMEKLLPFMISLKDVVNKFNLSFEDIYNASVYFFFIVSDSIIHGILISKEDQALKIVYHENMEEKRLYYYRKVSTNGENFFESSGEIVRQKEISDPDA